MKRSSFRVVIAVASFALWLQGCVIPYDADWTEEVLLHDGRIMDVRRTVTTGGVGTELSEMFSRGIRRQELSFKHPTTGKWIHWAGDDFVDPMALEVVDNRVYLIVLMKSHSAAFREHGCPVLAYVGYIYSGRRWDEAAMADLPIEVTTANIAMDAESVWRHGDIERRRTFSTWSISTMNKGTTRSNSVQGNGAYYQLDLPRHADDWRYKYKDSEYARSKCVRS